MAARFDSGGRLANPDHPKVRPLLDRPAAPLGLAEPDVIEDHFDVGEPSTT